MTDRNSWGGQPRKDSWGAAPGTAGHAGSGLAPRKETSTGKRAGVIAAAIASVIALAGGLAWAAVAVSGGNRVSRCCCRKFFKLHFVDAYYLKRYYLNPYYSVSAGRKHCCGFGDSSHEVV